MPTKKQIHMNAILKRKERSIKTVSQYHTPNCDTTQPFVPMHKLDEIQQTYILNCPHQAHDSVRLFMGYEAQLENSQLVRKM